MDKDAVSLCEYAKHLEKQGQYKEALSYYIKASKEGSIEAKQKLRSLERKKQQWEHQEKRKKKQKNRKMFSLFLTFLTFTVLLFFAAKQISTYAGGNVQHEFIPFDEHVVFKKDELLFLTVVNAIERYKDERGEYPDTLKDFIQINPENWLSFIPKEMKYQKVNDSYTLHYKEIDSSRFADHYLFSLVFYPESNVLSLFAGNKNLMSFPVASGVIAMPFTKSKVSARVVEPNGKGSFLGTRGIVLEDLIAIHGTNNPNSIGDYVTKGSVRMYNPDIEILYSYVSLGTPFEVRLGKPDKPMYETGLPILHNDSVPFENESVPSKTYKWKN